MKKAKAIIGAVLGGLVGAIPWILLCIFGNMMLSLLAAIIAWGAIYGYKLFGGRVDNSTPTIIIIISLSVVFVVTMFINPMIEIMQAFGEFDFTYLSYYYSEGMSSLMYNLVIAIIFTALGISGVIANLKREFNIEFFKM